MYKIILFILLFCSCALCQQKQVPFEEIAKKADSLTCAKLGGMIKELLSVDTSLFIPHKKKRKTTADKILDYLFMETNMIAEDAIVVRQDIENITKIIEEDYFPKKSKKSQTFNTKGKSIWK